MDKRKKLLLAAVFFSAGLASGQASAALIDTALGDVIDTAVKQVSDLDTKALNWEAKFATAAAVVAGGGFIIRRVLR
jgi:hypothetical protein